MPRKSTMVELVKELLKRKPPTGLLNYYDETLREAKAGEYHDYKNVKYVCGKVAVVGRLRQLGFDDLAARVTNGEFDEEADDQDKAMLKRDALEGGFNEEQCRKLFNI